MTDAPPDSPPRRVLQHWHAVVILGVLVAVFFSKILLRQAFLWEDFLVQVYPFRDFAAVSLSQGQVPLWNPYAFAGMPFQADIQSAVFYLPNLLLTFFVRDGYLSYYALEVVLIAHYWIAATGMYFLAIEFDLDPIYALFSAIVFGFSGFLVVHAIHPGFVEQAAWFPWIVLCLHRSITRRSVGYALLTGLTTGHAVLAGAPQMSLFLFLLLFLYTAFALIVAVRRDGVRTSLSALWLPAVAVVVAVGIAAIQLVPTLELTPLSERDTLSVETAQGGRLAWQQLMTAVMPKLFGVSDAHGITFWGPGIYGTYWETCFYWGLTALFAAAFATTLVRRNRTAMFLVGLLALSFLLAVGDQFILYRVFFAVVPGFSKFRAPARILVLATFSAALLGGMGLKAFVEWTGQAPQRAERMLMGALGTVLCLWGLIRFGVFLPSPDDVRHPAIRALANHEARIALLLAFGMFGLGLVLTRRWLSPSVAVAGLVLFQYADLMRFGADQNNGFQDAATYFHGQDATQQTLLRRFEDEGQHELFRITPRNFYQMMLDRNEGMVEHIYMTDGYSALRLRRLVPPAPTWDRTLDLLNAKYRVNIDSVARTMNMRLAEHYLPHAFLVPAATVVEDDSAAATLMRTPAFDPQRLAVLDERPVSPIPTDTTLAPDAGAHAGILAYGANHLRLQVTTARAAVLMLSEIYYPGWRAYIDGVPTPVYRADWNLRALLIPAGSHAIVMNFAPRSFRLGAWITLVTFAGVLLVWLFSRRGDTAP